MYATVLSNTSRKISRPQKYFLFNLKCMIFSKFIFIKYYMPDVIFKKQDLKYFIVKL